MRFYVVKNFALKKINFNIYYKSERKMGNIISYLINSKTQKSKMQTRHSEIKDGILIKFDVLDLDENGHYNVPEDVKYLGPYCFDDGHYNKRLKSITIHNGVERIGVMAFCGTGLRSLKIPSSVKYIGRKMCLWCNDLQKVEFEGEIELINDGAFQGCDSLSEVVIKEGTKKIGVNAFSSCKNLKKIVLPDSVEKICNFAFSDCSNLTEVNIPKNINQVECNSFYECPAEKLFSSSSCLK